MEKTNLTPALSVHDLSHEGKGIARLNGKVIFVEGALPGEKVIAKILARHRQFDETVAIQVESPTVERVVSPCPHVSICGGCSLQHVHSLRQLHYKSRFLIEQLKHLGGVESSTLMPPLQRQVFGYRKRARLSVRYVEKKKKLLMGFREKNGRFVADLNSCAILDPKFTQHWESLQSLLMTLSIKHQIPQVEVACGDVDVAIVIRHLAAFSEADLECLLAYAKKTGLHLYVQPQGLESIKRLWPEQNGQADRLFYALPAQNLTLGFHPRDFTQIHFGLNRAMVEQALSWLALEKTDRVLDCFSGLGNFTLAVARLVSQVVGVEGELEMVSRLKENAMRNGIENVEAFAFDLTQSIAHLPWAKESYTKIILDPPRMGAAALIPQLIAFQPSHILYISCHAASFAKDAGLLQQQGYFLEKIGIMDMFPHTAHIETMGLFRRNK